MRSDLIKTTPKTNYNIDAIGQSFVAVSFLASAITSYAGQRANARMARIQEMSYQSQVADIKLKGEETALFLRKKFLNDLSSATASFVGRGIDINSGIGLATQINAARNLNLDLKSNEINTRLATTSPLLNADYSNYSAKAYRSAGLYSSFLNANDSALSGYKAYSMFQKR